MSRGRVMGTYPFMDVRLMNQDNAELANECQAWRGSESDLSADLTRKISAALSGWSALGPVPRGTHRSTTSSLILLLSTLYHFKNTHNCFLFLVFFFHLLRVHITKKLRARTFRSHFYAITRTYTHTIYIFAKYLQKKKEITTHT